MAEIPETLKCPIDGKEYPMKEFRSTVNGALAVARGEVMPGMVTFSCPDYHTFTLRKAQKARLFTKEQVTKIIAEAERVVKEWKDSQGGGQDALLGTAKGKSR